MIIGAHVMLKSKDDVADEAFLTDILKLSSIDAGEGFLIFGLPPAEVAVHEAEQNGEHELYLMCESIEVFVAEMQRLGVPATPPVNQGWGTLTEVALPGGGTLNVYEPHHARPGGVRRWRGCQEESPEEEGEDAEQEIRQEDGREGAEKESEDSDQEIRKKDGRKDYKEGEEAISLAAAPSMGRVV